MGGVTLTVDYKIIDLSDSVTFKGVMLSGILDLLVAVGYTNASWTLKCDLTSHNVSKLLSLMEEHGYRHFRCDNSANLQKAPITDLSSVCVKRAIDRFPTQGTKRPWRLYQNYFVDFFVIYKVWFHQKLRNKVH